MRRGSDRTRTVTAQTLNSGCSESASTASLVTALMVRYSPCSSFQWNGAKQLPGRTRSVTTAGSTARPRRDVELDRLAVGDAQRDARRSGWSLDERPAVELVQLGDPAGLGHGVPLVLQPTGVEHQREVVVGQFARRPCAARAWNTARRDGVGNASRGRCPSASTNRSWLTPSLR